MSIETHTDPAEAPAVPVSDVEQSAGRRRGRRTAQPVREQGEPLFARRRRRPAWVRAAGVERLKLPSIFTSTRQAEALNPALVSTHLAPAGPPLAFDVESGKEISADPHVLYEQGRITSPVVLVAGVVGAGKSFLVKTGYVARSVATGKQVAVFDRKDQQGRGEYHDVARVCGGSVFEFSRSRKAGINLLDPNIVRQGKVDDTGNVVEVGQDHLLLLAAEYAHGALSSRERWALSSAHHRALAAADAAGRVATIRDVIEALYVPDDDAVPRQVLIGEGLVSRQDVTMWGLDLAMDLERFVDGDLSGLVDAQTRTDQDWNAKLLVFDTSDIPENSPALSLVMALVSTFLSSVWSKTSGRRVLILEEGYHTASLTGPGTISVAGILRGLVKRGRGIGLVFVTVVHHISDIPNESDAMSLLREAQVVHMFRQDRADDRADAVKWFGLPSWSGDALLQLDRGEHLLKVANEPARRVRGLATEIELAFTDTDAAMRGNERTDTTVEES